MPWNFNDDGPLLIGVPDMRERHDWLLSDVDGFGLPFALALLGIQPASKTELDLFTENVPLYP
jgi:hypothetical protein